MVVNIDTYISILYDSNKQTYKIYHIFMYLKFREQIRIL